MLDVVPNPYDIRRFFYSKRFVVPNLLNPIRASTVTRTPLSQDSLYQEVMGLFDQTQNPYS